MVQTIIFSKKIFKKSKKEKNVVSSECLVVLFLAFLSRFKRVFMSLWALYQLCQYFARVVLKKWQIRQSLCFVWYVVSVFCGLSGSSYLLFLCRYARVRAHVCMRVIHIYIIIIIIVLCYPDVYFCV